MMNKQIFVTQSSMPPYEEYTEAIKPLWESHWLTNMGVYHQELENALKKYLNVPNVSLMVNGHMALELVIQAMGFPENSEVVTTPFTFISTTHAIVRNHLRPVFCDVKISDGTLDETKLEDLITEKTVAILPVHVYGHVCNIEKIQYLADKYHLKVIYDAAHAFGVKYKGRGVGNFGDASIFSFHATKIFNTIEGGAAVFADEKMYEQLYGLKNFGIRGEEIIDSVGTNAKMNEFSAIMGLCNLKYMDHVLEERKKRHKMYKKYLDDVEGIHFFEQNPNVESNYAYFPIIVEKKYPMDRDELYCLLREHNYFARKYFYPLTSDVECFQHLYKKENLENARRLSESILALPFYENLDMEVIREIAKIIMKKEK